MRVRIIWAVALTVIAVACVDSTGPGGSGFGQLRLVAVFSGDETPEVLRLSPDSVRVEIARTGEEAPLVDTIRAYLADETLGWVLSLLEDEELLPVRLELFSGNGMLYAGDDALAVRVGTLGGGNVHDVLVGYVGPPRAMAVSVTPESSSLDAVDASVMLTATAFDGEGEAMEDKAFEWTSSAPEVATVSEGGVVTAVGDGVAVITATVDDLPAMSAVTVEILGTTGQSTIAAAPTHVKPDGDAASLITVRLFDGNGHPLAKSGGTVTLTTTLGTLTEVADHDNGTYTAELRSTEEGTAVVRGTLNGEEIDSFAEVSFTTDPVVPPGESATITAEPAEVVADGEAASLITVRLFDGAGEPLPGSGGTVTLTTTLGTLTEVADHDNGTYTAELRSTEEGTAVVRGALNGEELDSFAEVSFTTDPVVPPGESATITAEPTEVVADGDAASLITVRLFDGAGEPLPGSGGTVTLTTTLGTLTEVADHDNGTYTAELRSTEEGTAVVRGALNGEEFDSSAEVSFTTDPTVPPVESVIDVMPGSDVNPIHLGSPGVTPVAILTRGTFDAQHVDAGTVRFAGAAASRWSLEDVDGDGRLDMILHFPTRELELDEGDTTADLTGRTLSGLPFVGSDVVRVRNRNQVPGG